MRLPGPNPEDDAFETRKNGRVNAHDGMQQACMILPLQYLRDSVIQNVAACIS
jgi:hypothetical protein